VIAVGIGATTFRVRRCHWTPVRGCDYGVPDTGVARLARKASDSFTQRVTSPGADKQTGWSDLRDRSPLLRMFRTWLASDGKTLKLSGQILKFRRNSR